MSAIDNGYEVEKEQLYKVVIDHKYLVQLLVVELMLDLLSMKN